jgi:putative peptidoglycan lipid II flippase
MTTFTPELATAAARGDMASMRAQLSNGLRLISLVIVPAAALYIGLGRPIIVTLLQRGAFTASDAAIVSDTLTAFAVGLLPFSFYLFSLRVFYARHDTYTPFWINCIENGVNIALAFPLYAWLGVPGLALSFAIAYFVAAIITLVVLHGRLHGFDGPRIASTVARTAIAGVAVGFVSWGVANLIGWSTTTEAIASLVAGTLAGALVYVALLAVLRVDELGAVLALVPGLRSAGRARRSRPRV